MQATAPPAAAAADRATDHAGRNDARPRPGTIAAALRRLRRALRPALLFAPAYGLSVAAAVAGHLIWREQDLNMRVGAVLILFALGALVAGLVSWPVAAAIAGNRPLPARFSAMAVVLTMTTAGVTAFLFFLQFRIYYAQFHAAELGRLWLWQLMFTGASAVYIFLASGLRMLLPFGLPVLFAAAYLFARRPRI